MKVLNEQVIKVNSLSQERNVIKRIGITDDG